MKSPPADIFVWGVHPDTTLEDIVNDLAESDIKIETKDVLKKSKDDASLNSYKISVPASDLQKALNPDIWPLRVKVREYIYYSRKPKQQNQQQGGQSQQQQSNQHDQQQQSTQRAQQQQNVQQQAATTEGVEVSNRYDPLLGLGGTNL